MRRPPKNSNLTLLHIALLWATLSTQGVCQQPAETLPSLSDGKSPADLAQMWAGFDPRAEPLEVEVLKEWEDEGVVLRIVRFRIGIFKGAKSMLAGIYGFPKRQVESGNQVAGLLQIHGGGQYADHKACLANAKRGYATLSIAWAGRISAPEYRVSPAEVQLFWEERREAPNYRVTTDWGAVDGYHAPSRNPGNVFPSANSAEWTLDEIESPRNSGWFLCALAARRALTFLERQPEVDQDRLGVYGHSMGGKLTVMTAIDKRVKAAAPSCGGISDRYNASKLFRSTIGDDVSLKQIHCPIIFLSPSNDFHGRIGDLPASIDDLQSSQWRVTCSPHHNHQDTAAFEVATLLWFDEHLKQSFVTPATPELAIELDTNDGIPSCSIKVDDSLPVLSVDVFYSVHGNPVDAPLDIGATTTRFWHHVKAEKRDENWSARLPLPTTQKPLWVYANVSYQLEESVSGAGYYYRIYDADSFNLSSLIKMVDAEQVAASNARATLKPTTLIEDFQDDWEHEWFTYRPAEWPRTTHKLRSEVWNAPEKAILELCVKATEKNKLVILLDGHAAEVQLVGGGQTQEVLLHPGDFRDYSGEALQEWKGIRALRLTHAEHLRPARGKHGAPRVVGGNWKGPPPTFERLRWR